MRTETAVSPFYTRTSPGTDIVSRVSIKELCRFNDCVGFKTWSTFRRSEARQRVFRIKTKMAE